MTASPRIDDEFAALEVRLLEFITAPQDDAAFDAVVREVFAFQFERNLPYRNYCLSLPGKPAPDRVDHWTGIPAVPTDAWKHFGLQLTTCPEATPAAVFRTSGTTRERAGQRGEHAFPSLALYHGSILAAWQQLELPELPLHFLTASPADAPDSSLAHMMGVLDGRFNESAESGENSRFHLNAAGELDVAGLTAAIEASPEAPITLAGTALAFLHLLDHAPLPLTLPPGSRLLETGGYKGLRITLEKADFYQRLAAHFGVPVDAIHNEYSMTELSSQFYTRGLDRPHRGPHWTRVRITDPETGANAAPGQPGFIEILDLANLGSCLALRTADLGIAVTDDARIINRQFTLLGRDPKALPRGCSRSADEVLRGDG